MKLKVYGAKRHPFILETFTINFLLDYTEGMRQLYFSSPSFTIKNSITWKFLSFFSSSSSSFCVIHSLFKTFSYLKDCMNERRKHAHTPCWIFYNSFSYGYSLLTLTCLMLLFHHVEDYTLIQFNLKWCCYCITATRTKARIS